MDVSKQDVVIGKIYFLLVRIKLKHMEVEIRRRETTGAPAQLSSAQLSMCTSQPYEKQALRLLLQGAPPARCHLSVCTCQRLSSCTVCCAVLCHAGAGSAAHNESETIAKYEIMDGAPVRGEAIPIR